MVHFMRDFGRICRRFAQCACQMSQYYVQTGILDPVIYAAE